MSLNIAASRSEELHWSFQFAARHCHWLHRRFFFLCVAKAFSIASFISPRGFPRIISGICFLLCLVSLICEEDFLQNNYSLFFLRMLASSLIFAFPWSFSMSFRIFHLDSTCHRIWVFPKGSTVCSTNLMTCSAGSSRDIFSFVHLVSSMPLQCMKKVISPHVIFSGWVMIGGLPFWALDCLDMFLYEHHIWIIFELHLLLFMKVPYQLLT